MIETPSIESSDSGANQLDPDEVPVTELEPMVVESGIDKTKQMTNLSKVDESPEIGESPEIEKSSKTNDKELVTSATDSSVIEHPLDLPDAESGPKPEPTLEDHIAEATRLSQELIDSEANPTDHSISVSPDLAAHQRQLMDELDKKFGTTQKTGWELIESNLKPFAITVAGQIHWNQSRVSAALKNWISIQEDPDLSKRVPANWRHFVAGQTIDWLIRNSKVSDRDTTQHRYADLLVRARGVLRLAGRFASDSAKQSRQIDTERFLLAAAEKDTLNGLKLWKTLDLSKDDCSAQLGHALASLASARLTQAKPE